MANRSINRKRAHGATGAALLASIAVAGGSFAIIAASGGAASADTTSSSVPVTSVPVTAAITSATKLQEIQAAGAAAITRRIDSLNAEVTVVQGDAFLGSDGSGLVTNMQADMSGLTALGEKLAADTEVSVARVDYRDLFVDYRTYWFVLPDAHLVIKIDRDSNVNLPPVQSKITALDAEVTSSTPQYVVDWLTDGQRHVTHATTALGGLTAQLLADTAAEWNANHRLFATANGGLSAADWDIYLARVDIRMAEHYFNHHKGSSVESTTTTTTAA